MLTAFIPIGRGLLGALVGYTAGAGLTIAVRGGDWSDPVVVVFGYVLGLVGWLFGVGIWSTWAREWVGKAPKDENTHDWKRYFTFSPDHKVIGIQYLVTFIVVMLLGGALAMLMRTHLLQPDGGLLDTDTYNTVMSLHGIFMVAVAVASILGAFGNYLIPLMIGAEDMAFPRVNAVSFWLIPPVAVALLLTPLLGGFDSGWTAYPPLSVVNADGQVLFAVGVITFGVSSILGGVNILTTVAKMRAPGMTWGRLPIFVWSAVAASLLAVTVTQFFAGSLVLILLDRIAGTTFFEPTGGGDPLLYQHLFWFYSHPAVYIMVLPGFGVMLEVVSHFSRKPLFAYRLVVAAFMAIAGLSVIVWAHHMFTSGMAEYFHLPFMAATELISIPTGIVFLSALGTIWMGRVWIQPPMLMVMAQIFNFAIGGITGIFLADVVTDVSLHDTYFVVAHFHYTVMGSMLFAFLAAIYYWFPKVTGRMYDKRLANIHTIWFFIAFNATFIPLFWAGINGMNRRVATYTDNVSGANQIATVAGFLLGLSFLVFVWNLLWSSIRGPQAGDNPWNADSLEWKVSSPPPEHNFPQLPEVTGPPYAYGEKRTAGVTT